MKQERVSYAMFFCVLILVKNGKASLKQVVPAVPLAGNAKQLAEHLISAAG
jgi:hypothetical protein